MNILALELKRLCDCKICFFAFFVSMREKWALEKVSPSALVIRMWLFQQSDVGEGEVTLFAFTLTLPLAVHVDLGHLDGVAHLTKTQNKQRSGYEHRTN